MVKIKYLKNKELNYEYISEYDFFKCKNFEDLYKLLSESFYSCVDGEPNFWFKDNKWYHSQSYNIYCEIISIEFTDENKV